MHFSVLRVSSPFCPWRETSAYRNNADRAVTPTSVCLTTSCPYQPSSTAETKLICVMWLICHLSVIRCDKRPECFFCGCISSLTTKYWSLPWSPPFHHKARKTHRGLTGQSHATPAKNPDYFPTPVQENSSWGTPSLWHLAKLSWAWGGSTNGRSGSNSPSAVTTAWASVAHNTFLLSLHWRQNGDKQEGCNSRGM